MLAAPGMHNLRPPTAPCAPCRYDPDRVFEGPLLTRVITRAPAPLTPGCDVARSCFCEADVHCGRGHVCVPGAAFPEYKLCKPAGLKAKLAKLG